MAHKEKLTGQQKFETYYSDLYGTRWNSLREALLKDSEPVSLSPLLLTPYYMDKASILVSKCLPVKEGDSVLDMCAAPGGKTLSIALSLNGKGSLTSNDRSADRRNRLIKVLDTSLDENLRSIIKVTPYESSKWSLFEKDRYDCILLDAPCSSERHVIKSQSALDIWGTNRPKVLSNQQYAMLCSALDAVKVGGFVLYSTCSINRMENQDVISKLRKKREDRFEEISVGSICKEAFDKSEELENGRIILPDMQSNLGPLYFCLIRRVK